MFKPSWRDALEAEEPPEKKAVAYAKGPDGRTRVVAVGTGAAADEIIARAEQSGVEVRRSAEQVEELLREEAEDHSIPPEIYELMSAVINFAQELNEQWLQRAFASVPDPAPEAAAQSESPSAEEGDDEERF